MPATPLREIVRRKLRALRAERALTQEALCERAGLSLDAVTRIEGGSRVPTLDTLERLAKALDVGVVELVRRDVPARAPVPPTSLRRVMAMLEREPPQVVETVELVVRAVVRALHRRPTAR